MIARLVFAALLAAAGPVAAQPAPDRASPIVGVWATATDHGRVEIAPCGPAFCGKILAADFITAHPGVKDTVNPNPALRDRPVDGLLILRGFVGGPSEWRDGTLYDPEHGGTYHGKITLRGADQLKLTGCIIYPLCQSQIWTRVK